MKLISRINNKIYRSIHGPKRYSELFKTIDRLKAKRLLEIGVWNGERAVKMIQTAQKHQSDIEYFGFDLFEDLSEELYKKELSKRPPSISTVQSKLEETGASISLFMGNTLDTLPEKTSNLPKMDFIFIDGGHSNETVLNDWKHCKELMHKKTVLIFDDYWHNRTDGGSKLTVDAIDREKYNVEIVGGVDRFTNTDFGKLEISFAKVSLRI